MTLTIVNHYTHEKTFTVVGEPNGAVKKLREHGYDLNPRIHDDANLPPYFFPSRSDGNPSHNPSDATSSSREVSILEKDPSDFLEEGD